MSNFALTTDGRSTGEVERRLRRYLPGLDVRLTPFGARQALIRGPLVRALEIEYPNIGAGPLLQVLGVEDIKPLSDEETIAVLRQRDEWLLPERPVLRPASAAPGVDWHLAMVRAPQAWARLGGAGAIDWGSVLVGQIDTGYTRHPVFGFGGTSWVDTARAATFFPSPPQGEVSMFPAELGPGQDNLQGPNAGHGTRIGATICGHAPGAPGGAFHGAAPCVPLLPVRITDSVIINHAQREFAQALDHVVAAGAGVVNVSLGIALAVVVGELKRAIDRAYEAGVIVVCAAGNYVDPVVAPARLNRTLAIAGVTDTGRPWTNSSFGPEVDFSAPAADLRRANASAGGGFGYGGGGDGTSYASALASGAAALWLRRHRDALAAAYPQPWQRVEAFATLARATAKLPPGVPWQPGAFGSGILDIDALLAAPLPAAAGLQRQPAA